MRAHRRRELLRCHRENYALIRVVEPAPGLVPADPPANECQPIAVLGPQATGYEDAVFFVCTDQTLQQALPQIATISAPITAVSNKFHKRISAVPPRGDKVQEPLAPVAAVIDQIHEIIPTIPSVREDIPKPIAAVSHHVAAVSQKVHEFITTVAPLGDEVPEQVAPIAAGAKRIAKEVAQVVGADIAAVVTGAQRLGGGR